MMNRLHKLFSVSAVLLGARVFGAAVGFASQLLLARSMSAESLGLFYAATSMAAIFGFFCSQGYPAIAARFLSRYGERKRNGLMSAFVRQAKRETFLAAAAAAFGLAAVALAWPGLSGTARAAYTIAAFSIPAYASIGLFGSLGGAIRLFYSSLLPETLIRPTLFLVLVVVLLLAGIPMVGSVAVLALSLVTAVVAVAQWAYVARWLPGGGAPAGVRRIGRRWRGEAWPLVLVMLFTNLLADLAIFTQSAFLSGVDLAAFSISIKLAVLVGYAVQIAHQVALPDLADAYARHDAHRIRVRLLKAAALPVAACTGALIATELAGEQLLALFGEHFTYALRPLQVMLACQLLRAVFGPNTSLLTLEGAQRTNAVVCGLSGVVLVAASAALAPSFGLWGAVAALALTYAFWMTASAVALYRTSGARTDLPALLLDLRGIKGVPGIAPAEAR